MSTLDTSSSPTSGATAGERDLEPGEVVGEFEIESKLGQGGFGTVFRASHPLIGKVVAIKVLARRFSADPEMVDRFIAEARSVNQIRHRHIIDIFSFGELEDGRRYYVMEYLEGETLDARLERDGALPLAVALPILRAIGRALDAAHAKGIAHRDLKPENVFLAHDGDGDVWPKLLDFGIAKLLRADDGNKHKTRTGIPIGTPYYMSPEQCRGRDVDHRTDYYAFGVVAYQLLTGAFPIDGEDYMTILMRQMEEEPSAPSTLNAELPPAVDDAIAWLMRKDPAARPPDLATAIRALEGAAGIVRATPAGSFPAQPGLGSVPPRAPTVTPAPPKTMTSPEVRGAFAATMAPPALEDVPRSRRVIGIAAGVAAVAIAVVAYVAVSHQAGPAAPVPPKVAPVVTPTPTPTPVAAPTQPPLPAIAPPVIAPPPVPPVTPPPPVVAHPTPPPPSHPLPHPHPQPAHPTDSANTIEDPFKKP